MMKSMEYYNEISNMLNLLSSDIQQRSCRNLQDINIHAEYFYMHLLNLLYGWDLRNLNDDKLNEAGADLIYIGGKILVQVSVTASKNKIQHSLDEIDVQRFDGFRFYFMSTARGAKNIRNKNYNVPEGIQFDAKNNVLDIDSILKVVIGLPIEKQEQIHTHIQKYMPGHISPERREMGLSKIIQILSRCDSEMENQTGEHLVFEIMDKIKKNGLDELLEVFKDFSLYQTSVEKVYRVYDEEGTNKSRAVLYVIGDVYRQLSKKYSGPDLFREISGELYLQIKDDESLHGFFVEDIKYYIDIILFDAFQRCKIFKNPNKM